MELLVRCNFKRTIARRLVFFVVYFPPLISRFWREWWRHDECLTTRVDVGKLKDRRCQRSRRIKIILGLNPLSNFGVLWLAQKHYHLRLYDPHVLSLFGTYILAFIPPDFLNKLTTVGWSYKVQSWHPSREASFRVALWWKSLILAVFKTMSWYIFTICLKYSHNQPHVPPPPPRPCLFCADRRQSSWPANRLCNGWIRSVFFRLDRRSVGATLKKVGAASTSHRGSIPVTQCIYSTIISFWSKRMLTGENLPFVVRTRVW